MYRPADPAGVSRSASFPARTSVDRGWPLAKAAVCRAAWRLHQVAEVIHVIAAEDLAVRATLPVGVGPHHLVHRRVEAGPAVLSKGRR